MQSRKRRLIVSAPLSAQGRALPAPRQVLVAGRKQVRASRPISRLESVEFSPQRASHMASSRCCLCPDAGMPSHEFVVVEAG